MTLEQLLTAKGYTAQELADLAPLLGNAKFRSDMEAELSDGIKAKTDLDEYDRWFTQEITPEHQALLKRTADAEAEAASAKAKFESYQKSGMFKQGGADAKKAAEEAEAAAEKARQEAKGAGLDTSKFVSNETFQQAYEKTGEAIAVATNIVTQHMQLFPGQYIDMEQLQQEARKAKKPVKEYWESKFNVPAKRIEIAAKEKTAYEDGIRADERKKLQIEFGGSNPNLQIGVQSNNPFVIKKQSTTNKQPWEQNANEITRTRVQQAIEKAAGRGELRA